LCMQTRILRRMPSWMSGSALSGRSRPSRRMRSRRYAPFLACTLIRLCGRLSCAVSAVSSPQTLQVEVARLSKEQAAGSTAAAARMETIEAAASTARQEAVSRAAGVDAELGRAEGRISAVDAKFSGVTTEISERAALRVDTLAQQLETKGQMQAAETQRLETELLAALAKEVGSIQRAIDDASRVASADLAELRQDVDDGVKRKLDEVERAFKHEISTGLHPLVEKVRAALPSPPSPLPAPLRSARGTAWQVNTVMATRSELRTQTGLIKLDADETRSAVKELGELMHADDGEGVFSKFQEVVSAIMSTGSPDCWLWSGGQMARVGVTWSPVR
jgi:hypothetical protein